MENKRKETIANLHCAFNDLWAVYMKIRTTKENDTKLMETMKTINRTITFLEELEK